MIFKRLAGLVPLLVGISFVSFFVVKLAPGSPVDAASALNPKMSLEAKEKLTKLYELDKPLPVQYLRWAGRIACFDLGRSFTDGEKVTTKILQAIPVTLLLNGLTLFVVFTLGIPIGIYGALKRGRWGDRISGTLLFAGYSVPTFWLALLLMTLFGVQMRWLPVSGLHSIFFEEMSVFEKTIDLAKHLVLPVFVASITGLAAISRYMRQAMIEILDQNYIRTARAKGLPERLVIYRHAFRNAVLPIVTLLGLSVPGLLGGSVIFETVFSIPGMGRLFYNSVFSRDYPVIMGILVLGAVLTLLGNLLADLAYALADPRIRLSKERVR